MRQNLNEGETGTDQIAKRELPFIQWPSPKAAIWNPSGEWIAQLAPRAMATGWQLLAVDALANLLDHTVGQPRVVAIVAWSNSWHQADWLALLRLAKETPTLVVGVQEHICWEIVLRQFGVVGVFYSILQAPQVIRLMNKVIARKSTTGWSLEMLIESDLMWGCERVSRHATRSIPNDCPR